MFFFSPARKMKYVYIYRPIVIIMDRLSVEDISQLQQEVAEQRDERSYRKLFIHFHRQLTGFARDFVRSEETAEEIVSDVMLKIWTMRGALLRVENLKLYLYRAVRNSALNHIARNKTIETLDFDTIEINLQTGIYGSPEDQLLDQEFREKVMHAISLLPPKCQMVYKLVREDGFSYREVGEILGISTKTVDRHLNNALHKLIASVEPYLRPRS